ncbi:MAG: hypothetical protein Q8N16_02045 [bacterium]|nr:hypothetical protein [bacterium]
MENQDLEKKLERVKVPEIELLGHKQKLRAVLLKNYAKKEVFSPFRSVALGFAFVVLFALVLRVPTFQRPDIALAKEIALRDSNFRSLIEQGGIIGETELAGSRGYMLVRLGKLAKESEMPESIPLFSDVGSAQKLAAPQAVSGSAFLVEVDFRGKKVSQIKELPQPSLSFNQEEEEAVREISEQSQRVRKEIPLEAEIKEIRPVLIQLKLVKKGNKIEVLSGKEAAVIYKKNGQSWEGRIDLESASVKKIELVDVKE